MASLLSPCCAPSKEPPTVGEGGPFHILLHTPPPGQPANAAWDGMDQSGSLPSPKCNGEGRVGGPGTEASGAVTE